MCIKLPVLVGTQVPNAGRQYKTENLQVWSSTRVACAASLLGPKSRHYIRTCHSKGAETRKLPSLSPARDRARLGERSRARVCGGPPAGRCTRRVDSNTHLKMAFRQASNSARSRCPDTLCALGPLLLLPRTVHQLIAVASTAFDS
jgi:hypothetical protein